MIEIIREEESVGTTERRGLPKDIKQMGKPDIGDRIYVENEVYQFLHPYSNVDEKSAYVLLGRFENYAGRECVFVEAAIFLAEVAFDGDMPIWNDHTWAYIYKQLRREYDNMVIVGWAMDVKGLLPNMTMQLEKLHQNNFGGEHQVLFLMDSLEREEAFYGTRNGHLCRREGFYVYYNHKNAPYAKQEIHEERETQTVYEDSIISQESSEAWDFGQTKQWRGSYRQQMEAQKEHGMMPSYASTFFLVAVMCILGATAYLNGEKMKAMEATLAQMNKTQQIEIQTEETERPEVTVENVAGNVQKQENQTETAVDTSLPQEPQVVEEPVQSTETVQSSEVAMQTASESVVDEAVQTPQTTVAMTEAQTYLNQGYYIVQKGDSLVGICKKIYQTTAMMDKLCEVNGIDDADAIYAGQRLTLPN